MFASFNRPDLAGWSGKTWGGQFMKRFSCGAPKAIVASLTRRLALLLTPIAIATPAYADWQYAKWGATPAEVIAASGQRAQLANETSKTLDRDGRSILVTATHVSGTRKFNVNFFFRDNHLVDVQLELKGVEAPSCYGLETDLTGLYGEPLSKTNGSGGNLLSRRWADSAHNNQVAFLFPTFADTCFVTYSPIQNAETSGL